MQKVEIFIVVGLIYFIIKLFSLPYDNTSLHHPQVSQSQEARGGKGDKCMFLLYIDASSIINGKGRGSGSYSISVGIEFSLKDYYGIQVRPFAALILFYTFQNIS